MPYLEFEGEFGGGGLASATSRRDIVNAISISDIGQFLIDSDFILAIDDANFADDNLLRILSGLAKYITDNSENSACKIIFIGADDIYLRIISLEDSLKDRTDEISLGSIRDVFEKKPKVTSDKVWDFISSGLCQLGLADPRKDKYISIEQKSECKKWINYAADGLPKSIITLGRRVAEYGEYRSRVSHSDIMNAAKSMVSKNYRQYRSQYRSLILLLQKDKVAQELSLWMFKRGASRIHRLEEVGEDLREIATYAMFDEALQLLSGMNFIIVTGSEGNVFFAKDPLLAHTIGVALHEPDKSGVDPNLFRNNTQVQQMLLRFSGDKDPEHKKEL